ncbi:orf105 (mitochondrion) [Brassica oleracea]|uniref:Orf105 n=1 Tax=Brassica oleracea TaxID=3712 RepID=G4XYF9_BRAOL|nr:orf105 [Brassica oleracea]AEH43513.1 orf105 [Brassica oleracea]
MSQFEPKAFLVISLLVSLILVGVNYSFFFLFFSQVNPEGEKTLIFLLSIVFLVASFFVFVVSHQVIYPEIDKGDLVNPLQVLAQLSCLLVLFSGSRAAYAGASTG